MMTQKTIQVCGNCKTHQIFLIWCNECDKFYCAKCFKEYEVVREATQHSHSYGELLRVQK